MAETIRGTVTRTYHSSPDFSAGVLTSVDGRTVRFCGKFCANDGDVVALVGAWRIDRKYGHQFVVESLSYELPETVDGLVHYLAKNPAFHGIGEATARRIVEYAGGAEQLDHLIRTELDGLRAGARVPGDALQCLRDTWVANSEENAVRSYLAGYGLTHSQMNTLLERFGNSVVSVLKHDPYELIKHVRGYGFKKVDKIARSLGVAKDHPGRIEAAVQFCVDEQINDGHTWTPGSDLLDQANDVLVLDGLDSLELIQAAGNRLLERGALIAEDCAVTVPWVHQAERTICEAIASHAWSEARFLGAHADEDGLRRGQVEAYRTALRYRVSVISGGAGTGKTFIVARLANTFRQAGLSTRLCAPTGKAAKRIEQLLREHGLDLEASTIHRMLRYDGRSFGVDQVDADVLIVDEVSMVDVPLMAALLERIDHHKTRLILVGDHNQLPPVGPGNVLRDLIQHELAPVTVLDEVVRQAGVLKVNSMAVLDGRVAPSEPGGHAWSVIDCFRETQQIQVYLRELVLDRIPERLGFDPVQDVQIITPTHLGALGTKAINRMMQDALHGRVGRKFAVGGKVIQTVNNYDLGVMNGTIGFVRQVEKDGVTVEFEGRGLVELTQAQMANVHLAYALTAHKCVAGDTLIPTAKGLLRIEDLASGIASGEVAPRLIDLSTLAGPQRTASLHNGGVGNRNSTAGAGDFHFDGALAACALWEVALSNPEIAALAAGADPWTVRNADLIFYWPATAAYGFRDAVSGSELTVIGPEPPLADDPPQLLRAGVHRRGRRGTFAHRTPRRYRR